MGSYTVGNYSGFYITGSSVCKTLRGIYKGRIGDFQWIDKGSMRLSNASCSGGMAGPGVWNAVLRVLDCIGKRWQKHMQGSH